jgi:hypothetical protein
VNKAVVQFFERNEPARVKGADHCENALTQPVGRVGPVHKDHSVTHLNILSTGIVKDSPIGGGVFDSGGLPFNADRDYRHANHNRF